ncbi:MAG: hypothetical protein AMXMBFR12_10640, partial [Candidatus Babeliales bacterium]
LPTPEKIYCRQVEIQNPTSCF